MPYDIQYLGRNLNDRTYRAVELFRVKMADVMRQAAAHHALNSSRTFLQFAEAARIILDQHLKEVIQFTYSLTEETDGEPLSQVAHCGQQIVERMLQAVREKVPNVGGGSGYNEIVHRMQEELTSRRERLLDATRTA